MELSHPVVDVCIICSNFEESLRFYRDDLGFEVVLDIDVPADRAQAVGLAPRGFRQVRLQAGQTLIKLVRIASPPARRTAEFAAGVRWLTFFVANVRAEHAALKAKGVSFLSDPTPAPGAAGVVCALDPDGILIELVEPSS